MTAREFKQQLQWLVLNKEYTVARRLNIIEDALLELLERDE